MFYTYILFSKTRNVYYKGFTADISKRLEYHNTGKSNYTSKADDWVLVYCKEFEIKKEALIEEKRLKKLNTSSLEKIISNYRLNKNGLVVSSFETR